MSWSKLHTDEWLLGSIRKYPPEVRALWPDIQAQATDSVLTGSVCISPQIGYEKFQLCKLWNCTLELLEKSLLIFIEEKYIKIHENGVIELIDWNLYQSEYQRLLKYRKGTKKSTKKGTQKHLILSDSVSVSDSESNSESEFVLIPEFRACSILLQKRILEKRQQKITDKTLQEWDRQVRLMVESKDCPRTVADIQSLINECHDMQPQGPNAFTWARQILSMGKLREKWDEGKIFVGMNKQQSTGRVKDEYERGAADKYKNL